MVPEPGFLDVSRKRGIKKFSLLEDMVSREQRVKKTEKEREEREIHGKNGSSEPDIRARPKSPRTLPRKRTISTGLLGREI